MNLMNQLKARLTVLVCVLCFHSLGAAGVGVVGGDSMGDAGAKHRVNPSDLVGHPAPALSLDAFVGSDSPEKPSWSALRGKVVVLEFWATWCVPCVQSIPHLNEVADAYTGKNVRFIFITDEDRDIVERFIHTMPIHGWVGLDSNRSMNDAYGVESIPQTFVVDKTGKVAALLRPKELTPAVLDAVLAGKPVKTLPDQPQPNPKKTPREGASTPVAASPSRSFETPSLFDSAAMLQIVIAPIREESPSMEWYPGAGAYANTQVDLQELLVSLLQLPTASWIRWDTPMPSEKLHFVAKMPNRRADLLEKLAVPALEASLGLTITRESVETDVYVLTAPDGPLADLRQADESRGSRHSVHQVANDGVLFATDGSFELLVQALDEKLGRPVIDETGFSGRWDWGLRFEPNDTDSLVRAAKEQLGLLLTPERRMIEMVVVRKASSKPDSASPD